MTGSGFPLGWIIALLLSTVCHAGDRPVQPSDEVYVGAGPDAGLIFDPERNISIRQNPEPDVIELLTIGTQPRTNDASGATGVIRRFKNGSKTAKLVFGSTTSSPTSYARDVAGKWTKDDAPAGSAEARVLELYMKDMLSIAEDMQKNAAKNAGAGAAGKKRSTLVPSSPRSAVSKDCENCPEMVPVEVDVDGKPRRFRVARYELTWKEYLAAMDEDKCAIPTNLDGQVDPAARDLRDNFPMTSLKLSDFDCYLAWINRRTDKPYRLPTEAEWIAIARKATGKSSILMNDVPSGTAALGGNWNHDYARRDPRRSVAGGAIWRVGQFAADKLGLFDLFGNALEATSDRVIQKSQLSKSQNDSSFQSVVVKGGMNSPDHQSEFDLINSFYYYGLNHVSGVVGFRLIVEEAM
jgi:hypothetical protein